MRTYWSFPRQPLLRACARERRESTHDAAARRAIDANAVLGRVENDGLTGPKRPHGQLQASAPPAAVDVVGSDLSQAAAFTGLAWASDLSVSATRREGHSSESGLERRHHIRSLARRRRLPGGDHRLALAIRAQLGSFDDDGASSAKCKENKAGRNFYQGQADGAEHSEFRVGHVPKGHWDSVCRRVPKRHTVFAARRGCW